MNGRIIKIIIGVVVSVAIFFLVFGYILPYFVYHDGVNNIVDDTMGALAMATASILKMIAESTQSDEMTDTDVVEPHEQAVLDGMTAASQGIGVAEDSVSAATQAAEETGDVLGDVADVTTGVIDGIGAILNGTTDTTTQSDEDG